MITKERFEELIKEGAVIYDIFRGDIYPVNLLSLIKYGDIGFEYHNDYYHCDICRTLSDFYETREEAEWEQEFGRIIRTERLELPTWEEVEIKFNKKQIIEMYFYYAKHFSAPKENNVEKTYSIYLLTNGHIVIDDNREVKTIFNEELTKENYTLACRKAKELFLGENK